MFKSLALFALLSAVLASASVARAPAAPATASVPGEGPVADAGITVMKTCVDVKLKNCLDWTVASLPVGCTNLAANGQASSVSSVQTAAGVGCTLFTSKTCTGSKQFITGTINNLGTVGFNNKANSFTCAST
ncbi:hypothetical protein MVEN_02255400 [Mycena venus]|uniref:Uncharacterized protein n=1 Tax=Mycena venus TaxID=2733690 RepID=A0A8H7CF70_9AGAR|nr:hypothetical protein MVEN_02255400 [Mycena venus]